MIVEAGLQPEIARTEENTPLVRTAVDPRLVPIARDWTRGPSRRCRRNGCPARENCAWTLAAGSPEADRYLLGLDPHAPDTHSPLASALMRVDSADSSAPAAPGPRRISGRRRLSRLVENVGEPPGSVEAFSLAAPRRARHRGQFASGRAGCEIGSCQPGGSTADARSGGVGQHRVERNTGDGETAAAAAAVVCGDSSLSSRPPKARKIASFLGSNYIVESSCGHIRDLPGRPPTSPPSTSPSRGPAWGSTSTPTSSRSTSSARTRRAPSPS